MSTATRPHYDYSDYVRSLEMGELKLLFVSHRTRSITRIERTATGWDEREFRAGEAVAIESPQLTFAVDDVYAGLTLDPA